MRPPKEKAALFRERPFHGASVRRNRCRLDGLRVARRRRSALSRQQIRSANYEDDKGDNAEECCRRNILLHERWLLDRHSANGTEARNKLSPLAGHVPDERPKSGTVLRTKPIRLGRTHDILQRHLIDEMQENTFRRRPSISEAMGPTQQFYRELRYNKIGSARRSQRLLGGGC